jgi:L-lactate dehydrogenase complex protein LldG
MNQTRETILTRLRRHASSTNEAHPDFSVMEEINYSPTERSNKFVSMLEAARAEVHRTTTAAWPTLLMQLAAQKGAKDICYAPDTVAGKALEEANGENQVNLRAYDEDIEGWKEELYEEVDASVTEAMAGIAHTGSLVLWPTPKEPRLMSLVPPIHFAVISADKLYNSFYELMRVQDWRHPMPTNALLISGPSKTADIEQMLVFGVHGPKQLVVLLLEDS